MVVPSLSRVRWGFLGCCCLLWLGLLGVGVAPARALTGVVAPIYPDYQERAQIIASYETIVATHPSFITQRLLAGEYLKRFREQQDVEDLLRAEQAARQSLKQQTRHNQGASLLLASALLGQHRFREALRVGQQAGDPTNPAIGGLLASVQMELGHYEAAATLLQGIQDSPSLMGNPGLIAVQARYQELTGDLDGARQQMEVAAQQVDQFYTTSAELRAWFQVRAGDLALSMGDLVSAEQHYQQALQRFPAEIPALTGLARLYAAQHRWPQALEMATQGSLLVPLVENLAVKADAQRALGQNAEETEALIEVVAHLSRVKGIYDRALAVYYSEHDRHLPTALTIARQERALRDDIFAADTLAWAAAKNERWTEAEQAIHQALRTGTQDPLILFHAGVIALHGHHPEQGQRYLQAALDRNSQFHPVYADVARELLAPVTQTAAATVPEE